MYFSLYLLESKYVDVHFAEFVALDEDWEWLHENVIPVLIDRTARVKNALKSEVHNAITIQAG